MTDKGSRMEEAYKKRIRSLVREAPWVLRVTEYAGKPVPVVVIKERIHIEEQQEGEATTASRRVLRNSGLIYGPSLRRCLPVIRGIVSKVCDPAGIPLELSRFIGNGRIDFRGNLPLDDEAGVKLALIFKLQERLRDLDRVELIARRVERFSREEAHYWLTRSTQFGPEANRWAQAGMRIMLGGQPGDEAVVRMLERLQL